MRYQLCVVLDRGVIKHRVKGVLPDRPRPVDVLRGDLSIPRPDDVLRGDLVRLHRAIIGPIGDGSGKEKYEDQHAKQCGGARAAEEPAGKCQWARGDAHHQVRYRSLLGEQGLGKGRTGCTAAPWSPRSSTRPRGKSTSRQCNRKDPSSTLHGRAWRLCLVSWRGRCPPQAPHHQRAAAAWSRHLAQPGPCVHL